jgi:RecB family endonuclease NucS
VTYNPSEREEGYPVIHLEPLREERVLEKSPELAGRMDEASEGLTDIPFTLEKQIEDVLERDVSVIEPRLTLFESEGRRGRQYPTDVGIIDLLCRRPNGDFVVVELKRGRASDTVVGQISRYMGWVKQHVAEGQNVYGIILPPDADDAMQYAVSANPNICARYLKLKLEIYDRPPD